jgi:hypothetical protein
MIALKIPRVCTLTFDPAKGWTYSRVAMFTKGFKRAILSDAQEPSEEWPEDFARGYAFADKCRLFCQVNSVDLINLKRAGIWTYGTGPNHYAVHGRPSRKNLVESRFTVYTRT